MFMLHGCQNQLFIFIIRTNFYSKHYSIVMMLKLERYAVLIKKSAILYQLVVISSVLKLASFVKQDIVTSVILDDH